MSFSGSSAPHFSLRFLRSVGGAAILATFVPSCLVFYHVLPNSIIQPVMDFYKNTNFLYLFITAIIVGSILGMERQTLIRNFLKIFVPLASGSIAPAIVGTLVGTLLGMGATHTFFFTVAPIAVVYPLLFLVGVAVTPWDKLIEAFQIANIITIFATVATLMATGSLVGKWLKMYPIETAIVNATHSGQGGTGDVAILTAADRMVLMPFAQVATRIRSAITVTLALIALKWIG